MVAITDRREIEFDTDAVKFALECSPRAANAFGLPPLTPTAVRCRPVEALIQVTYGMLTATRVFSLQAEALGAILIAFCNRTGMPMPRAADKAVRIEREHVVVVLTLRLRETPQLEGPEPPIGRLPDAIRVWSWIESVD